MRALIITTAGMGSRFTGDLPHPCLKSIYYELNPKYSLLYQILEKALCFDKIVIVGGYLYEDLLSFIAALSTDISLKVSCIYNNHYSDYGSGYSLYLGIKELERYSFDEIVFVEGDLYYDKESWCTIVNSNKNVLTINTEPIVANKAVALYVDLNNHPHYTYSTSHESLFVKDPFRAIFNSAQIWKFTDIQWLNLIVSSLDYVSLAGTNLEIIGRYYERFRLEEIDVILVNEWLNCNTLNDYKKMLRKILEE